MRIIFFLLGVFLAYPLHALEFDQKACEGKVSPDLEKLFPSQTDWEMVKETEELNVYNREVVGTSIREVLAIALVKSPSWRVFAAITDYEHYKDFMPYVEESQVSREKDHSLLNFQQLNFPFFLISDRYYTIELIEYKDQPEVGFYQVKWNLAESGKILKNGKGEPVRVNKGSWTLTPICSGKYTHVIYQLYTDPGGSLFDWMINLANNIAVPNIIKAVRDRVSFKEYDRFPPES